MASVSAVFTAALGSPSANALARAIIRLTSAVGSVPTSSCSTSSGTTSAASRMNSTMGGVRPSVRLINLFNRFSMHQQYSAIRSAPTMRPLPLSVWNDRRTVISVSMSSGDSDHAGKSRLIVAISSLASSINNSSNSGSRCAASGATTGTGVTSTLVFAASLSWKAAIASRSSLATLIVCDIATSSSVSRLRRFSRSRNTARQASALSSMYHGSLRPAFTVSM